MKEMGPSDENQYMVFRSHPQKNYCHPKLRSNANPTLLRLLVYQNTKKMKMDYKFSDSPFLFTKTLPET